MVDSENIIMIVEPPITPISRLSPKKGSSIVLALIMGLIMGIVTGYIIENKMIEKFKLKVS